MKIIKKIGNSKLATVYVAEMRSGKYVEFVESVSPPIPRKKKWVSIVSTLFGCPSACLFCDAGVSYHGKLASSEIIEQIEYLVNRRYPTRTVDAEMWKIQFARMGDPAFNPAVIDVLERLPSHFDAPGLMPSISTIAPTGTEKFFESLLEIKHRLYPFQFQFQFSIHSTDDSQRALLIPKKTWSLKAMADFGRTIYLDGGRRTALNFALISGITIEPDVLLSYFSPEYFVIKVTPLNPTVAGRVNGLRPISLKSEKSLRLFEALRYCGFEVIVSIGELEENLIGSNCGQYISAITGSNYHTANELV